MRKKLTRKEQKNIGRLSWLIMFSIGDLLI